MSQRIENDDKSHEGSNSGDKGIACMSWYIKGQICKDTKKLSIFIGVVLVLLTGPLKIDF